MRPHLSLLATLATFSACASLTNASADPPCGGPGPCWADLQTVNVRDNSAPGRTGQWWCNNHFGSNLGGAWECVEGTGSSSSAQVPATSNVQCGRMHADGTTPYFGAARTILPFGYGRVERVLVYQSAPGRTGQWWCSNHFGNNYGGSWKCRSVSGGNTCSATVPNGELASCSEYSDLQSVSACK